MIMPKISFYFLLQLNKYKQETTMKLTKKLRYLALELFLCWLIIANFVTPIICMDSNQRGKGILNADLPMPGADVPIISLSTTSSTKSSKAYSQVCDSY